MTPADQYMDLFESAAGKGCAFVSTIPEIDRACDHVVRLLGDASLLLEARSYGSSVFFSITALEETAKIHVSIFRRGKAGSHRQTDALFSHSKKHQLAVGPTLIMGSRLKESIGEHRLKELIHLSSSGGLVKIREASLYVERSAKGYEDPQRAVTGRLAWELLLFSIEAFDDALVGYTSHSLQLGWVTDSIFARWQKSPTWDVNGSTHG